jgi:hypothetical protein
MLHWEAAPVSFFCISRATPVIGVSGPTQKATLCITSRVRVNGTGGEYAGLWPYGLDDELGHGLGMIF